MGSVVHCLSIHGEAIDREALNEHVKSAMENDPKLTHEKATLAAAKMHLKEYKTHEKGIVNQVTKKYETDNAPTIKEPKEPVFTIEHEDGTESTGTAHELMEQADSEAEFAKDSETIMQTAINCFLSWGDI